MRVPWYAASERATTVPNVERPERPCSGLSGELNFGVAAQVGQLRFPGPGTDTHLEGGLRCRGFRSTAMLGGTSDGRAPTPQIPEIDLRVIRRVVADFPLDARALPMNLSGRSCPCGRS